MFCRFFTLIGLLSAATASAQTAPVAEYLVFGKGIASREQPRDSVALLCRELAAPGQCRTVQFARFYPNGRVDWLGQQAEIEAPGPELRRDAIRLAVDLLLTPDAITLRDRSSNYSKAVIFGPMALMCFVPGAGWIALGITATAAAGLVVLGEDHLSAKFLSREWTAVAPSLDQKSWNWASEPGLVSAKKYGKILLALESDQYESRRYRRRLRKLEQKGVRITYRWAVGIAHPALESAATVP